MQRRITPESRISVVGLFESCIPVLLAGILDSWEVGLPLRTVNFPVAPLKKVVKKVSESKPCTHPVLTPVHEGSWVVCRSYLIGWGTALWWGFCQSNTVTQKCTWGDIFLRVAVSGEKFKDILWCDLHSLINGYPTIERICNFLISVVWIEVKNKCKDVIGFEAANMLLNCFYCQLQFFIGFVGVYRNFMCLKQLRPFCHEIRPRHQSKTFLQDLIGLAARFFFHQQWEQGINAIFYNSASYLTTISAFITSFVQIVVGFVKQALDLEIQCLGTVWKIETIHK